MNPKSQHWFFFTGAVLLSFFGSSLGDKASFKMSLCSEPDQIPCKHYGICCDAATEVCDDHARGPCKLIFAEDENITAVCCEALQRDESSREGLLDKCKFRLNKGILSCTREVTSITKQQTPTTTTRTETSQLPETSKTKQEVESKWNKYFRLIIFILALMLVCKCLKRTTFIYWVTLKCPTLGNILRHVINTKDIMLPEADRRRNGEGSMQECSPFIDPHNGTGTAHRNRLEQVPPPTTPPSKNSEEGNAPGANGANENHQDPAGASGLGADPTTIRSTDPANLGNPNGDIVNDANDADGIQQGLPPVNNGNDDDIDLRNSFFSKSKLRQP